MRVPARWRSTGARRWAMLVAGGVVVATFLVALLAAVGAGDAVARLDRRITDWVVAHRSSASITVMRAVTHLGDTVVVFTLMAVVALALVFTRHRFAALTLAVALVGNDVLVSVLKRMVARPRPPAEVQLSAASGWSFPSGHAAQGIACYCGLAALVWFVTDRRPLRVAATVAAIAIAIGVGWSRVWLGVHWTSDVVAGWALGGAWLLGLLTLAVVRADVLQAGAGEAG